MAEMVQYAYECQCKGHTGGSRTFYAAPPEWFASKGIPNTPKNCPDCKEWMKSQVDEQRACACGVRIRISHKRKISHHKKTGPYEPITECGPCSEGKKPPKGAKKPRHDDEKEDKNEKPMDFSSLPHGISPERRPLTSDGSFYRRSFVNFKTGERETRWDHISHHIPGAQGDWTESRTDTSPSAFAVGPTVESLLGRAYESLLETSRDMVREYEIGRRIVRVSRLSGHDNVEITILESQGDGTYGLVTTYDNVTVKEVDDKFCQ